MILDVHTAGKDGQSSTSGKAQYAGAMPGELAMIEVIRKRAARGLRGGGGRHAVRLGIGDDCAILQPPAGHEVVVTTDMSLEGRHFRRDWHPPQSIGHRVLARGLSDIAAMGAQPMAAFLSLALPRAVAKDKLWLKQFLDGMMELAAEFDVPLAGGDTAEAPGEMALADIVLLGSVARGKALRRSGARAGDALYCTGWLGGAAQELAQLEGGPQRYREARRGKSPYPHLFPQPRLAQGRALVERGLATACIDLSDGLSTDLLHLCEASGVSAEVDVNALPAAPRLRGAEAEFTSRCVLHGGEDYELLFTARPETRVPQKLLGVQVTRIGTMRKASAKRPRMLLTGSNGFRSVLEARGWEHFREPR